MGQARLRVFQVATGNVGTEMIKRLQRHPDLELVGVHVYTPEKVGRDVGEIAGKNCHQADRARAGHDQDVAQDRAGDEFAGFP